MRVGGSLLFHKADVCLFNMVDINNGKSRECRDITSCLTAIERTCHSKHRTALFERLCPCRAVSLSERLQPVIAGNHKSHIIKSALPRLTASVIRKYRNIYIHIYKV